MSKPSRRRRATRQRHVRDPSRVLRSRLRSDSRQGKALKKETRPGRSFFQARSAFEATEFRKTTKAQCAGRDANPAMGRTSPTLRRAWPQDGPMAAICVQNVDVQCVLQFTLIHAAGCVLHRRTSRVIHRQKLFFRFVFFCIGKLPLPPHAEACRASQPAFPKRSHNEMVLRKK